MTEKPIPSFRRSLLPAAVVLPMLALVACAPENSAPPPFKANPWLSSSDGLERTSNGHVVPPPYDRRDTPFTNQ